MVAKPDDIRPGEVLFKENSNIDFVDLNIKLDLLFMHMLTDKNICGPKAPFKWLFQALEGHSQQRTDNIFKYVSDSCF